MAAEPSVPDVTVECAPVAVLRRGNGPVLPGSERPPTEISAFERMTSATLSRSAAALSPSEMASLRFWARSATCLPRNDATAATLVVTFASDIASSSACCISAAVPNLASGAGLRARLTTAATAAEPSAEAARAAGRW